MICWSYLLSLIKLSLVIIFTIFLSGCGYIYGDNGLIKSQKFDYVNAKQTKELAMPESLSHDGKANFTVLPKIGAKAENQLFGKDLSQAAPVQLLAVLDNTRVDKNSAVPAVLIVDERGFIWLTITKFLEKNQVATSVLDKNNYVVISQWVGVEDAGVWLGLEGTDEQDLNRAKYKISITEGQIRGEHKVVVERIGNQFRNDDDEPWNDKLVQWHESADMMNLLLSYYDTQLRLKEIKHQQKLMAGFKVELGKDSGENPALVTNAKQSMIWEKIPRVMAEIGFKVIDKDLRQNTYFMEYEKPEEGFFASLFSEEQSKLPLEEGAYQITLDESGDRRTITFKDGQGVALKAELLVKLYPELSRLFGDRR